MTVPFQPDRTSFRFIGLYELKSNAAKSWLVCRSFVTCALARYYFDDQVKEDEMGGACSTHDKL